MSVRAHATEAQALVGSFITHAPVALFAERPIDLALVLFVFVLVVQFVVVAKIGVAQASFV